MNQHQWVFSEPFYKPNRIGILHGPKTGHLLVYVNAKVLIIDFKVLQSRDYSFMLDDHLVQVEILEENGVFDYILTVGDYKVKAGDDSRVEKNRLKEIYKAVALIAISAIVFAIGMWALVNYQTNRQFDKLDKKGKVTEAIFFLEECNEQLCEGRYEYVINGAVYRKEASIEKSRFNRDRKAIQANDSYIIQVLYHPEKPSVCKILK